MRLSSGDDLPRAFALELKTLDRFSCCCRILSCVRGSPFFFFIIIFSVVLKDTFAFVTFFIFRIPSFLIFLIECLLYGRLGYVCPLSKDHGWICIQVVNVRPSSKQARNFSRDTVSKLAPFLRHSRVRSSCLFVNALPRYRTRSMCPRGWPRSTRVSLCT